jgi:hypothetical protein
MNKSDKLQLINKILDKLYPFYFNNGFTHTKGVTGYQRNEFDVMWGASSTYIDSLTFRPWFRLQNKLCSDVLKQLFPTVIGIELTLTRSQSLDLTEEMNLENYKSKFINSSSYYYSIEKDTPLEPIVEDHINFMNKVGLPFFEKVNSLEGINEFLNARILKGDMDYFCSAKRNRELKPFFAQREVLSGITSAYLINNPKIEELLNRYRLFFEGNNYVLEPMEKVVEYFSKK